MQQVTTTTTTPMSIFNSQQHQPRNYSLRVGPPNPKTLAQPVIPNPSHDIDSWKTTDQYSHSLINHRNVEDITELDSYPDEGDDYLSSYNQCQMMSSTPSTYHPHLVSSNCFTCDPCTRDRDFTPTHPPTHPTADPFFQHGAGGSGGNSAGVTRTTPQHSHPTRTAALHSSPPPLSSAKLNYDIIPPEYDTKFDLDVDGIDDEFYWNPDNVNVNLPSNLSMSALEMDPRFQNHNRNVFTQTIQPNVFSKHEVIEPINSNLGISFTPQFQPIDTEVGPTNYSHYTYTRIDPQLVRDDEPRTRALENPPRLRWTSKHSAYEALPGTVALDEIYDPRFTGYGPGYRSYVDPQLGQVRYYYSDVDAYKRPNFIIRSHVDHMDFQDPMGAIKPEYHRKEIAKHHRELVQDQYHKDVIGHRESIMESLMRKRNSEEWQLRMYPLRRDQAGAGGK